MARTDRGQTTTVKLPAAAGQWGVLAGQDVGEETGVVVVGMDVEAAPASWLQSTGHSSTYARSFTSTQGRAITGGTPVVHNGHM